MQGWGLWPRLPFAYLRSRWATRCLLWRKAKPSNSPVCMRDLPSFGREAVALAGYQRPMSRRSLLRLGRFQLQNETVAQCVRGHVRIAVETHFLQNSRSIRADRLDAQAQFLGDFADAV